MRLIGLNISAMSLRNWNLFSFFVDDNPSPLLELDHMFKAMTMVRSVPTGKYHKAPHDDPPGTVYGTDEDFSRHPFYLLILQMDFLNI